MHNMIKLAATISCLCLILFTGKEVSASPILIDLGQNFVATGVTRNSNGQVYLSGYESNPSTGLFSAVLVTINETAESAERTNLGTLAGNNRSRADAISGNYIVGATGDGNSSHGIAWHLDDPLVALPVEAIELAGDSDTALFDVNALGQFAGVSGGGAKAVTGLVAGGTFELQSPTNFISFAQAISEHGLIVGNITGQNSNLGAIWTQNGDLNAVLGNSLDQVFLFDISSNHDLIGGSFGVFDAGTEIIRDQAAVWSGANWQNMTLLQVSEGENLYGSVLAVTDNGYAVGTSNLGGFIWHSTWDFAQLFNNWTFNEFGLSIPTWVTSVNDIFFDGNNLNFALQGSAYFASMPLNTTPVPEPASAILLTCSSVTLLIRRAKRGSRLGS